MTHVKTRHTFVTGLANGHLVPGIPRSHKSPWNVTLNAFEFPCHFPGHRVGLPTARSKQGMEYLSAKEEIFELRYKYRMLHLQSRWVTL